MVGKNPRSFVCSLLVQYPAVQRAHSLYDENFAGVGTAPITSSSPCCRCGGSTKLLLLNLILTTINCTGVSCLTGYIVFVHIYVDILAANDILYCQVLQWPLFVWSMQLLKCTSCQVLCGAYSYYIGFFPQQVISSMSLFWIFHVNQFMNPDAGAFDACGFQSWERGRPCTLCNSAEHSHY